MTSKVSVTAVVGACVPERQDYARCLVHSQDHVLVSAQQVRRSSQAVEQAANLLAATLPSGELVVEYPLEVPAMDIIGELADPTGGTQLMELACVVDAAHLLTDLRSQDYLPMPFVSDVVKDTPYFASRAELIVTQLEYASTVLLVNWRKLEREEFSLLVALISHLSPEAKLDLAGQERADSELEREPRRGDGGPAYSVEQTRPGWLSLINGSFNPQFANPRVEALRYEQPRPFHPGRLHQVLDQAIEQGEFGLLLRSAGFSRLATRPHITAHWEQAGAYFSVSPVAFDHQLSVEDEMLAIGQDLSIIGVDLDAPALISALDAAVLTDDELTAGPAAWGTFPDPFPQWSTSHY